MRWTSMWMMWLVQFGAGGCAPALLAVVSMRGHHAPPAYCAEHPQAGTLESYVRYDLCESELTMADQIDRFYPVVDDDRFDQLQAALMVVQCAKSDQCDPHQDEFRPAVLGAMSYFAEHVSADTVRAKVAALELPRNAKDDFISELATARKQVLERVAKLDPGRRAIYVDLPAQVRARRLADRMKLAKPRAAFEKLHAEVAAAIASHHVTDALRDRVLELRESYVTACVGIGRPPRYCLGGPVARPLTHDLLHMARVTGDAALTDAESAVIAEIPAQDSLPEEIGEAEHAELLDQQHRADEIARAARATVVDEATLRREHGTAAVSDPPEAAFTVAEAYDPDRSAYTGTFESRRISAKLISAERRGRRAVLHFADVVDHPGHGVGCHETNKIERVDEQGIVYYQQECASYTETTVRHAVFVVVPAMEAAGLQPGSVVEVTAQEDTHQGYLVHVFAHLNDPQAIQLRTFRLDPPSQLAEARSRLTAR